MSDEYNISMDNCDVQALTTIVEKHEGEPSIIASLIIELRTLDKWLSTYIEGMLNRVSNGRIYTNINNSGAVTGRVSSDMQQQPSEPLLNKKGDELFHPRKVFVNDDNSTTYYFDFSQMELRLQANYTIDISGGDKNLCRAFIPFGCVSIFTNKKYRLGDENWGSGEWVDEDDNEWTPVDLHSITTLKAFPHLKDVDKHSPEFKHHRRLGKMCNFLKNYGGGTEAIKSQLGVTDEVANLLNRGYYEAFPEILSYQKWVEDQLSVYGYVSNIYGRKYYIQDRRLFYKAYNYLIQGGCADLVKEKEINLYRYFKENNIKSKILLPIHDELQVSIINGEEWLIPKIKEIMDDNKNVVKHIPMLCDIEFTKTNWAEKEDY
jgi:DNA polymerase-1